MGNWANGIRLFAMPSLACLANPVRSAFTEERIEYEREQHSSFILQPLVDYGVG